jgi:hypothetical protein
MRDAVMTISGRSGAGSAAVAALAGAGLPAAGFAAAVGEVGEHALKSAASAAADNVQAWRLVKTFCILRIISVTSLPCGQGFGGARA